MRKIARFVKRNIPLGWLMFGYALGVLIAREAYRK